MGETAVVGNQVSILQSVTLGGTGKEHGDRHPKIADGVLISAGAKILGNIRVGEGAKVVQAALSCEMYQLTRLLRVFQPRLWEGLTQTFPRLT